MRALTLPLGFWAALVSSPPARADVEFTNTDCTGEQRDIVRKAFAWGRALADRADGFMRHLAGDAPPRDSAYGGADWEDRRVYYERWFGPLEDGRTHEVQDKVIAIRRAFGSETFLIHCSVTAESECARTPETTIAWVDAFDIKKTIHLCDLFWRKSESGINSQGGALLHEVSHFHDIAMTEDKLDGRDPRSCEALGRARPADAIDNAYSYQFFAEDMPLFAPSFGCTGCSVARRGSDGAGLLLAALALWVCLGERRRRRVVGCAAREGARRRP